MLWGGGKERWTDPTNPLFCSLVSSVVPSGDHRGALVLRSGTLIKSLRGKKKISFVLDCFSSFKVVLSTWSISWNEESDLHKMCRPGWKGRPWTCGRLEGTAQLGEKPRSWSSSARMLGEEQLKRTDLWMEGRKKMRQAETELRLSIWQRRSSTFGYQADSAKPFF